MKTLVYTTMELLLGMLDDFVCGTILRLALPKEIIPC